MSVTKGFNKAEWIESASDSDGTRFLVCDDDEPVGSIALNPPNEVWGTVEIAYMIAPTYWG
ncbi:GNAT family N-acetyltransferase [Haloferacaceae archaeon DSL9]